MIALLLNLGVMNGLKKPEFMSEIQARVKMPRRNFRVFSYDKESTISGIGEYRTKKLMNFCETHFVLFSSLFVISSLRAYPLPLEYLLPSVCHSNEAVWSKRPGTLNVIIERH